MSVFSGAFMLKKTVVLSLTFVIFYAIVISRGRNLIDWGFLILTNIIVFSHLNKY
jgi:hypothetical protein